jgi:hypothetical protein
VTTIDLVVEQMCDGVVEGLPLAAVLLEEVDGEAELVLEVAEMAPEAVARAVVDHDHLLATACSEHRPDRVLEELGRLVEAGDDDGDLLPVVERVAPRPDVVPEEEREQVARVEDEDEQVGVRE